VLPITVNDHPFPATLAPVSIGTLAFAQTVAEINRLGGALYKIMGVIHCPMRALMRDWRVVFR